MHQFISKAQSGRIIPTEPNKRKLLSRILDSYENQNISFKITIEPIEKNINESQRKLYDAFILKAADHFGNTYSEMQDILRRFYPINARGEDIPLNRWSSQQLDLFITKSTAFLAEHGFHF
jgi:hypothetical protein